MYTPSKGKPKDIKSSMTTPNKILAMDLVTMEKFEVRGFMYSLNCIGMSSRFMYSVALKNKTENEVLNGFKKIYNKSNMKVVRSDNGSEFIKKKFKNCLEKKSIKQTLSMIERANVTTKELIENILKWVKILIGLKI